MFLEASYISPIVVLKKNSNVLNPLTVHSSTNPLHPHSQTTKRNKQFNNDKSSICELAPEQTIPAADRNVICLEGFGHRPSITLTFKVIVVERLMVLT